MDGSSGYPTRDRRDPHERGPAETAETAPWPGQPGPDAVTVPQIAAGDWLMQVQRFEVALHHMNQGLCMFDAQARLVVCNHRYREIFGIPADYPLFGRMQEEICGFLVANGRYPPAITLDMIQRSVRGALARSNARPVLRELANGRIISILYRSWLCENGRVW